MAKPVSANETIHRGYAADAADERRLRAAGVKIIYRGDKGEPVGKFRMRKGEVLAVMRGYLAFGKARRDWVKAEEIIHNMGAVILDLDSGFRSDRNGAAMVHRAIYPLRPTEVYQEMQKASVAKRVRAHKKTRRDEKIWRNQKLTVKEKVELIGIPVASLYRMYEKTGVPQGRRSEARRAAAAEKSELEGITTPKIGDIYFVRSGNGHVKIGFAADKAARLRALQTSHHRQLELVYSVKGTRQKEAAFHRRFEEYRTNGEWFRVAGRLKDFLARKGKRVIVTKRKK